jgi:hypothetical protein
VKAAGAVEGERRSKRERKPALDMEDWTMHPIGLPKSLALDSRPHSKPKLPLPHPLKPKGALPNPLKVG